MCRVGCPRISAKDSDQLRSTNVTARLESDGEIWLPMPAPRICRQKQPRAEKICEVRLGSTTISKMSLTYRHLVWKAARFKVPEYVDCTGSPRAERSTEIVTELRSLPKMFFMSQHPLIQQLMNGIKQTSLGNGIEKPHQIIIDTGQRDGIISCFKMTMYLSPNLRDTELAKIPRPRLFAYGIQGSASCFQQCGLETLKITNQCATFGPSLFSLEKNKAVRKLGIFSEAPLISTEETRGKSVVDHLLCHSFCELEFFKESRIIPYVFKAP